MIFLACCRRCKTVNKVNDEVVIPSAKTESKFTTKKVGTNKASTSANGELSWLVARWHFGYRRLLHFGEPFFESPKP